MKSVIITFVFVCITLFVHSQPATVMLQKADSLYKAQAYDSAIVVYQSIVDSGYVNAELYYNVGNAYFKNKELASAILYFEKAYVQNPEDKDIQYNLGFAHNQQVDSIDGTFESYMNVWFQKIYRSKSVNLWSGLSILFFVFAIVLMSLYFFTQQIQTKKVGFYGAIVGLIFCVFSLLCAKSRYHELTSHEFAIVMEPTVNIKTEPLSEAADLTVIHSGLKVRIIKSVGEWINIRLSDSKEGWILTECIEEI